jgi:hypothetical protein
MKPARGRNLIGDRIFSVLYQKGQRHACDPACARANHFYRHKYRKPIPFVKGKDGQVSAPARVFTRVDGQEELYATDNPPLLIVNGPKTTQRRQPTMATYKMRRNAKGRFVAVRNAPRRKAHRKHHAKKNPPFWTAGALVNKPRRARRSGAGGLMPAKFLGFPLVFPDMKDVLGITAGIAGPPLVKGFAMQLLPASITTSTAGKWGVEAGSYIVPAIGGYMLDGRNGLKMVLAGEAAAVAVRLLSQLTSSISANVPTMSSYGPRGLGPNALRSGGGVASYMRAPNARLLSAYADARNSSRSRSNATGASTMRRR